MTAEPMDAGHSDYGQPLPGALTAVNMHDLTIKPREWTVTGKISRRKINFDFGAGKICKSQLNYYEGLCIATGAPIVYYPGEVTRSVVVHWDAEDDESEAGSRNLRIAEGSGLVVPETGLYYVEYAHDLGSRWQEVRHVLEDIANRHPGMPLYGTIDSMMAGFGGDQRSESAITSVMGGLKELIREFGDLTWKILDHKPKHGDTQFGSGYKGNQGRNTWELESIGKGVLANGNEWHEVTGHRTQSNYRISAADWGARVEFQGDQDTGPIMITKIDVTGSSGNRGQVLLALADEWLTVAQLADRIELTPKAATKALEGLRPQGLVKWKLDPADKKGQRKLWHRVDEAD